jgi:distribution and morphology protein 10
MTLTLNPLMGNLSSTYSVLASPLLALSSRFDFNVYSYESEMQVGSELWRRVSKPEPQDLDWARRKMGLPILDKSIASSNDSDDMAGCLKARLDQRGSLGLLWEGRVKELLYSCGVTLDLKGGENMVSGFGLEMQYST